MSNVKPGTVILLAHDDEDGREAVEQACEESM